MKTVNAYQCDYCQATYETERKAQIHEATCMQNPNAKNCLWCKYHDIERLIIRDEIAFGASADVGEVEMHVCRHEQHNGKRCSRLVAASCKNYEEKGLD